jgi:hypothetical protein
LSSSINGTFVCLAAHAAAPHLELCDRCGAEGVACAQQQSFPLAVEAACELSNGGGLAHAVYPDNENDRRLLADHEPLSARRENASCFFANRFPGIVRGRQLAAVQLGSKRLENALRGVDSDVRRDQYFFHLIQD